MQSLRQSTVDPQSEAINDQLVASAEWLVDATVTPENRRLVYDAVFCSAAVDHVSRASTSVGAAPAPSM